MPAIELRLSDSDLRLLGRRVQELWSSAIGERDELEQRWERNRKFYVGEADGTGCTPKHIPSYHFPLVGPKIDALVDNVAGTITSGRPMMRCVGAGPEEDADIASKVIQFFYDISGFKRKLRQLCTTAGITGLSVVRPRFEAIEKGSQVDAYTEGRYRFKSCGLAFDCIDPIDFGVATSKTTGICSSMLVGHRFYRTRSQVEALADAGEYAKMDAHELPAADPEAHQTLDSSVTLVRSEGGPTAAEDSIEFAECVVKKAIIPGTKKARSPYLAVTIQVSDGRVMRVKEYPADDPMLVDLRLKSEETGCFWPTSSVGNLLQGLQVQYNDLQNFIKAGSLFAAMPPIIEKGAPAEGAQPYYPGERVQVVGDVVPFRIEFNPGSLWEVVQQIERQADAVIGVSQAGTAQQFKGDTTATEVANIQANQSTRLGGYVEEFAGGLERLTKVVQEILARNIAVWYPVYADELPEVPMEQMKSILERPWRWFSSARGAGDAPASMMAKMDRLLALQNQIGPQPEQIAQALVGGLSQLGIQPEVLQPAIESAMRNAPPMLDMKEIVRSYVTAMDFANADAILKPLDEMEEAEQKQSQEAGIGEGVNQGGGLEAPGGLFEALAGAMGGAGASNGLMQGAGPVGAVEGPDTGY